MAAIPSTGAFKFSDVIVEFGDLAVAAGRNKNLMSSYLGLVPGLPTTAPLKLSNFKGLQAALVLRYSQLSDTQKLSIDIASMFYNYYGIDVVKNYKNFRFILDQDRTTTLHTGSVGAQAEGDGIWLLYNYTPVFNTGTNLYIEVRANITGNHVTYRTTTWDIMVKWSNEYYANTTTVESDFTVYGGPALASHNVGWGAGNPTPAINCQRDCNIVRYAGVIRGGDYGGGDVRIAYSDFHALKNSWWQSSFDGKSGSFIWTQYQGFTEYAYMLIQGQRAGANPGVLSWGTYGSSFNPAAILDSMVDKRQMGSDTVSASARIRSGILAPMAVAGLRSGGGTQQAPYNKDWLLNGHKPGYDRIVSISRFYKMSVRDATASPTKYVRGTLQTTNISTEVFNRNYASQPGVAVNNHSVSITQG